MLEREREKEEKKKKKKKKKVERLDSAWLDLPPRSRFYHEHENYCRLLRCHEEGDAEVCRSGRGGRQIDGVIQ